MLHLKITLCQKNWTFFKCLEEKTSLSWFSQYFHHTSFISSNGPPISHYIHENHKRRESSDLFFSPHFLFSFIQLQPPFLFCFCSRPWTVLAVVLQNDKYSRLALCISLCYKHRSSLWLYNPGPCKPSRQSHLFSSKMLIEYSYLISFMLMDYELIKFSYYLCSTKQNQSLDTLISSWGFARVKTAESQANFGFGFQGCCHEMKFWLGFSATLKVVKIFYTIVVSI